MGGDLIYRLTQATPNARRLLALLALVFVPLLLVFAVVLPLQDIRRDTARAVVEAEALHLWVHARASALPPSAFTTTLSPDTPRPTASVSALEGSLVAAGMRDQVSRLSNQGSGAVEIAFDDIDFDAFITWLETASDDWGYDFSRLSLERSDTPGRVAAFLALTP